MLRTEAVLGGFFIACWLTALAYAAGVAPEPSPLPLDLYGLFTFAAAFGGVTGNLYVLRTRQRPERNPACNLEFGSHGVRVCLSNPRCRTGLR